MKKKEIVALLYSHRIGGNRKCSKQLTNADQKSLETVFLIAICRQWCDKWPLATNGNRKTLFLMIFDLRSSIILTFLITAYPVCYLCSFCCVAVCVLCLLKALRCHCGLVYNCGITWSYSLLTIYTVSLRLAPVSDVNF